MLGGGENRVGISEKDDTEWIGNRYIGSGRPLGDQRGGTPGVIVSTEEAQIDSEVVDQSMQQILGRAVQSGCGDAHQVGGHRGDQLVQTQRHGASTRPPARRRSETTAASLAELISFEPGRAS